MTDVLADAESTQDFKCEFCSRIFSNKYNLAKHQKTAKFCLDIQMTITSNDLTCSYKYKCDYCVYKTNIKYSFTRHLNTCKQKKTAEEKITTNLTQHIAELEHDLEIQDIKHKSELEIKDIKHQSELVVQHRFLDGIEYNHCKQEDKRIVVPFGNCVESKLDITGSKLETIESQVVTLQIKLEKTKEKQHYPVLASGYCFYICHDLDRSGLIYKIGKTDDIGSTLRVYRRNAPRTVLDYVVYLNKKGHTIVEDVIKTRYIKNRDLNHEVIKDIECLELIKTAEDAITLMNLKFQPIDKSDLDSYNRYVITPMEAIE